MRNAPRDAPGDRSTSQEVPRALIHKKILDASANAPEASLRELANEVNGASLALVERVLEEYGDPATAVATSETSEQTAAEDSSERDATALDPTDADEGTDQAADGTGQDADRPHQDANRPEQDADRSNDAGWRDGDDEGPTEVPEVDGMTAAGEGEDSTPPVVDIDPDALDEKQRRTLRAVARHPAATQRELADVVGVSAATISKRVNAIPGFEWSNRREILGAMFDTDAIDEATTAGNGTADDGATTSFEVGATAGEQPATGDRSQATDAADRPLGNGHGRATVTDGASDRSPRPDERRRKNGGGMRPAPTDTGSITNGTAGSGNRSTTARPFDRLVI